MSDILNQLFTLPVKIGIGACLLILVILYLLSIIWVNQDSRQRDINPVLWTIIAVIPVAGLVGYCLLRPPLTILDQDEQDMELDLLQRQLDAYGQCPHCGTPTERDFVICPKCHRQLRNVCTCCGRTLDPAWTKCPYCTTSVGRSINEPQ